MAYIKDLPEVHFGEVEEKPIDWRKNSNDNEEDEDAGEMSPELLTSMLGFDPAEIFPEKKSVVGISELIKKFDNNKRI